MYIHPLGPVIPKKTSTSGVFGVTVKDSCIHWIPIGISRIPAVDDFITQKTPKQLGPVGCFAVHFVCFTMFYIFFLGGRVAWFVWCGLVCLVQP